MGSVSASTPPVPGRKGPTTRSPAARRINLLNSTRPPARRSQHRLRLATNCTKAVRPTSTPSTPYGKEPHKDLTPAVPPAIATRPTRSKQRFLPLARHQCRDPPDHLDTRPARRWPRPTISTTSVSRRREHDLRSHRHGHRPGLEQARRRRLLIRRSALCDDREMTTPVRAAVLDTPHSPLAIENARARRPGPGEVRVRAAERRLPLRSTLHRTASGRAPAARAGPRGARARWGGGRARRQRPGARRHGGASWRYACGRCRAWYAAVPGPAPTRAWATARSDDGTLRFRRGDAEVYQYLSVGTFSEAAVVPASAVVRSRPACRSRSPA